MTGLFRIWMVLAGLLGGAMGGPRAWAASVPAEPLLLYNREVAELRAVFNGLVPAERVARAQRRFADLGEADLLAPVQVQVFKGDHHQGRALLVGDKAVFTLLDADLDPEENLSLAPAADRAARRLQDAIQARRAQGSPGLWLRGGAVALGVLFAWGLLWWAAGRVQQRIDLFDDPEAGPGATTYLRVFLLRVSSAATWALAALLSFAALVLLLEAFPWTAPWGDLLSQSVRQLGGWLVAGVMSAVPGLLTVLLVALVARSVQDTLGLVMQHVQTGRLRVPFLHADTVGATRRLLTVLVWGLALAVAYPFLPGSGSDAFKGLSVLFGLMITLGSTGVVTQLMSGLVVVYSRSLKKGDFIAVNGVEGVVSDVGALAVKLVTMRNEEITMPNALITGSAIHNYSKHGGLQGTLVSTRVTIGYDVPWRQVQALLVTAASSTPGVRPTPAPFVYQRALSDFYVEYELFAHIDKPLERAAILSALHAAIQDEFNRHGVQIMSPHFYDQPAQPVVVPSEQWYAAPARPPVSPSSGDAR
jgi:small-conductance mechanosensitive channel